MKFNNKKMVEECMIRIEMISKKIDELDSIVSFLYGRKYRGWNAELGNLRSTLIEEELNEWRNLFLWGLTLDNEERDRIKAAAYNRFLSDRMTVSHWFNNGISPSTWLVSDDEEFRKMAKEAFKPKEKE